MGCQHHLNQRKMKRHHLQDHKCRKVQLSSEAIEGPALPLQGIHHVHGSHSLPLRMLSVGNSVTDDILQENLQNTPGLFVDETTDPLDTTPSSKSPDCRLGNALDVIPQHLAVSLSTTFAQSLATFASPSHGGWTLILSKNNVLRDNIQ